MGKEIAPHFRLHSDPYDVAVILNEIAEQHTDKVKHEHRRARDNDGAVHFAWYVFIEHFVGHDWVDHTDKRNEQRRQHIEREQLFMGLIVAYEAFKHFLYLLGSLT
jgi:hypothetical protein